jgi:hypothetical protein
LAASVAVLCSHYVLVAMTRGINQAHNKTNKQISFELEESLMAPCYDVGFIAGNKVESRVLRMRSNRERLAANAKGTKVAKILVSIPASSDTVKSEWRQTKKC